MSFLDWPTTFALRAVDPEQIWVKCVTDGCDWRHIVDSDSGDLNLSDLRELTWNHWRTYHYPET